MVTIRQAVSLTPALLAMTLFAADTASAQEIYRQTWTFSGDKLAESVIRGLNAWSTRENPAAPTARLEQDIRVEVLAEYVPTTGRVRRVLTGLAVGPLLFGEEINTILPADLIDLIVERDYPWSRGERVLIDPTLSDYPIQETSGVSDVQTEPAFSAAPVLPGSVSYRPVTRTVLFAGLGATRIGLPGLTYGAIQIGALRDQFAGWIEIPLDHGPSKGLFLSPTGRRSFGAGAAVTLDRWNARAHFTTPSDDTVATGLLGAADVRWELPVGPFQAGSLYLSIASGGGFWIASQDESVHPTRDALRLFPYGAIEVVMRRGGILAAGLRHGTISIATSFLSAEFEIGFNQMLGVQLGASAAQFLLPAPDAVPEVGIHISPVLRF